MSLFAFSHGSIHIVQDDQSYRVVICCPLVLIPFEQSMRECYNTSIDTQTWAMREDHRSQQRYRKCQTTNLISICVADLELSGVSGIESCMSTSDIKISKFYMGFLAPVGNVFSQPEPVRNIFYRRLIRDKEVFLFSCFPFYSDAYRFYAVSDFLQSRGTFGSSKLKHYSLAMPISREDLNQFWPTVHVD